MPREPKISRQIMFSRDGAVRPANSLRRFLFFKTDDLHSGKRHSLLFSFQLWYEWKEWPANLASEPSNRLWRLKMESSRLVKVYLHSRRLLRFRQRKRKAKLLSCLQDDLLTIKIAILSRIFLALFETQSLAKATHVPHNRQCKCLLLKLLL